MTDKGHRILLIGPGSLRLLGGTTISFDHLRNELEKIPEIRIDVIDTLGVRGSGVVGPLRLVALMWKLLWAVRRCDVVTLHAMPTALPYIGWFLPLLTWLWGRPLIYRSFGGMYYDALSWPGKMVARFLMHQADVVLLQTQELMRKAESDQLRRVEWFPTARPMPVAAISPPSSCRRFVFVGHMKVAKGLQYLVRASEQLPSGAGVDVYGPWYDLPRNTFVGCRNIRYVCELPAHEVVPTLRQYDALVFPSFMDEEGYAGIILEAYAAGIPVIATRWKALPEIVEAGVSGLLIEPRDEQAILAAMLRLYQEPELYRSLAAGAQGMRERFSVERQAEHFLRICRELATNAPLGGDGRAHTILKSGADPN